MPDEKKNEVEVAATVTEQEAFTAGFSESIGEIAPGSDSTKATPVTPPATVDVAVTPVLPTEPVVPEVQAGPVTPVVELTVDQYKELLEKEKQKTSSWEGRLSAADRRNKELLDQIAALSTQTRAAQANDQGTASLVDVDDPLIKSFVEEMGEDFINPLNAYIKRLLLAEMKPITDKVPLLEQQVTSVQSTHAESHYAQILEAHDDVVTLLESGEVDQYVDNLPYKEAVLAKNVLAKGTAKQVIKLLDDFKEKTGKKVTPKTELPPVVQIDPEKLAAATVVRGGRSVLPKGKADANDFDGAFKEAVGG